MTTTPDPEATDGLLVITMINRLTGDSESEVYEVVAASGEDDALLVRDGSGPGHRWYEVVQRGVSKPVGVEDGQLTPEQRATATAEFTARAGQPSELEQYRELIRKLIENDQPCQGFGCSITMLGHLLLECTPEQQDMVRALDPSQVDR